MASVSVTINGRLYRMACDDGQEDHLAGLATELDQRIARLKDVFGEIGDMRLTVMAALMVSDELADLQRRHGAAERDLADLRQAKLVHAERAASSEAEVADALVTAAERIERIAQALNSSIGDRVLVG